MTEHDPASLDITTLHKYDLKLTNTTLSTSVNITIILSWVRNELAPYIQQNKLVTIENLHSSWQDGRAFLCLAHRFYPSSLPAIDDQLTTSLDDHTRISLAFSIFEGKLGIPPPSLSDSPSPTPLYLAKVRQALLSQGPVPDMVNENDIWSQRTNTVLLVIHKVRHQLQALSFHPPSCNNNQKDSDITNEGGTADMTDSSTTNRSGTMSSWEENLNLMEQQLLDLHQTIDEYHTWTNENMDEIVENQDTTIETEKQRRLALVQSVDIAYASLQTYVEHDQQVLAVFRKRAIFTQATAPIRQDLDWVQAEMLKTTTTDTGIKELEARVHHAGSLLELLVQQYSQQDDNGDRGQCTSNSVLMNQSRSSQSERHDHNIAISPLLEQRQAIYGMEVDALVKRYQLVQFWVDDVRVWFVEAQRIRQWINERINLLETSSVADGVACRHLHITADQVEDLNSKHEALEKEVEIFDKEDMSRLRTHVKDLTLTTTKDKDLSPADTTTIEITFTTLMTLDKLMHLLHRRSYELQILTLRVFWENEYVKTVSWIRNRSQELDEFIRKLARWQGDKDDYNSSNKPEQHSLAQISSTKGAIIDRLLDFEMEISTFDQGQFTITVNLYQEMDDTSEVELPSYLESRQVGVEESFEALVHRTSFARRVVEQYLAMTDFINACDALVEQCGEPLREKLVQQTVLVYTNFWMQHSKNDWDNSNTVPILDEKILMDEITNFQEQTVNLITDRSASIPYTESTSTLDHMENQTGNDRVQSAVKSRTSDLVLLGESLEHKLHQYRQAVRWHSQVSSMYKSLQEIQESNDSDINIASDCMKELTDTFGHEVARLPDSVAQDSSKAMTQELGIRRHAENIHTRQLKLDAINDQIHSLHAFHQLSSGASPSLTAPLSPTSPSIPNAAPITAAIEESLQYLKTYASDVAARFQQLTEYLDQWKSALIMMQRRQAWENQYASVYQWMLTHEQKCQCVRIDSTWSASERQTMQQVEYKNTMNAVLSLEKEWHEFKLQSLLSLENTFDQLVNTDSSTSASSSLTRSSWHLQHQRRAVILSKAEQVDGILLLAKALLAQRKAMTSFLIAAEDTQTLGHQWLYDMKTIVLHPRTDDSLPSSTPLPSLLQNNYVDSYNKSLAALLSTWEPQKADVSVVPVTHHIFKDDSILLNDLYQLDALVKQQASEQHDALLSLLASLKSWQAVTVKIIEIRNRIKGWSDSIRSLDSSLMDLLESLTSKKERLEASLKVDYPATATSDTFDFEVGSTYGDITDAESRVQSWLDDRYPSLTTTGLELTQTSERLLDNLLNIIDGNGDDISSSLDIILDVKVQQSLVDDSRNRCANTVKPVLLYTLTLMKANRQRATWEGIWNDLSHSLRNLQMRLDAVGLKKNEWMQQVSTDYTSTSLHDLTLETLDIEDKLYAATHRDGHGLLQEENDAYADMVHLYEALSSPDWLDVAPSHPLALPSKLSEKRVEWHQSSTLIRLHLQQMKDDLAWLATGVSWLIQADEQLEKWKNLVDQLDRFTESDNMWQTTTVTALEMESDLKSLQQRVDTLVNLITSNIDTMSAWRHDKRNDLDADSITNNFKCWQEKMTAMEKYRDHVQVQLKYASTLLKYRNETQQWVDCVCDLEHHAEMMKTSLLLDDGNATGEELDDIDSQMTLASLDERLSELRDGIQHLGTPPCRPIAILETNSDNVRDNSSGVDVQKRLYIRYESLKELSQSLHCISSTKQRSLRLKALVNSHIDNALETETWIKSNAAKLAEHSAVVGHDTIGDMEELESALTAVIDAERMTEAYTGAHYQILKESANQCVRAIESEIHNDRQVDSDLLDRVTVIQKRVDMQWQQWIDSLTRNRQSLQEVQRAAQFSHYMRQLTEKCDAFTVELNNACGAKMDEVDDQKLAEWECALKDIKLQELVRLESLVTSDGDTGGNLVNNHMYVDLKQAKESCQHLETRLQHVRADIQRRRRETEYTNIVTTLIDYAQTTTNELIKLQTTHGTLSALLDEAADMAHYDKFNTCHASVMDGWELHEQLMTQENDLFSALNVMDTLGLHQLHQQLVTSWTILKNEVSKTIDCHLSLTQQRSVYAKLYQTSSILDHIEEKLNNAQDKVEGDDENDDNDDNIQKQIERAKQLATEAMQLYERQRSEYQPAVVGNGNEAHAIFHGRHDSILKRVQLVYEKATIRHERRQLHVEYEQCQVTAKNIKAISDKESATIKSIYESLRPQQVGSGGDDIDISCATRQCQDAAKRMTVCNQVYQRLVKDATSLMTRAKSIQGLEQDKVDTLESISQLALNDLKNQMQQNHQLLDLIRRVLGHNKSANNVKAWLIHFRKALGGSSANDTASSNSGTDGAVEIDAYELGIKLDGFQPIIESLQAMHKDIQSRAVGEEGHGLVESSWRSLAQEQFDQVDLLWQDSVNALEEAKKSASRSLHTSTLARKIKSVMTRLGETRGQIEQLQAKYSLTPNMNCPTDEDNGHSCSLLKTIPRSHDISAADEKLKAIEHTLADQWTKQRSEIDALVKEYHKNDDVDVDKENDDDDDGSDKGKPFIPQQEEMDAAYKSITDILNRTKEHLLAADAIGRYLTIVDDIDVLLDSMDEVNLKTAPHYHATMIDNRYSKAELQAKMIELDARYDYYRSNIEQALKQAEGSWNSIISDKAGNNQVFKRSIKILEEHHSAQQSRWKQLVDHQVPSRKSELQKAMEFSLGQAERKTRLRKSSLPTRKAVATLSSSTKLPTTISARLQPSRTGSTTPSSSIGLQNKYRGNQKLSPAMSSLSLSMDNSKQSRYQRGSHSSTSSSLPSTAPSLTLSASRKKISTPSAATRKKPNTYVAQAGNALDMEIGRIINETPYRIKVQMVPGEVGRYWFGDVNPKLVYCRVLKSKMVMVRVGGGWAELSQFLRDHALLEGELIIPKQQKEQHFHTPIQEGYLETTTSLQRQRRQLMQQNLEDQQKLEEKEQEKQQQKSHQPIVMTDMNIPIPSCIPTMKKSRSTPANKKGIVQHKGYKDGDKFIAVDRHGNHLEVKMTKFSQHGVLPTSTTNRRRKVVKG